MSEENIVLNIEEMKNAGLQIGHKVSKLHPKMKQYVVGIKSGIHIIDLEKTAEKFEAALKFISDTISKGGNILIVGTKVPFREIIRETAIECQVLYVVERWLGGTFTNFETLKKRIAYYKDLELKKEKGELEKYTKKERTRFNKELEFLKEKFEGIKEMTELPRVVIILSLDKNEICAREARKMNIKIVGICDTNINPDLVDYPIPANDDGICSVKYILERIKETIQKAKANQSIVEK